MAKEWRLKLDSDEKERKGQMTTTDDFIPYSEREEVIAFKCLASNDLKCDTSTDYHKLCNAIKDESFLQTMLDNRIEYMPVKVYLNKIVSGIPLTLTLCVFGKRKSSLYTKIIEHDVEKCSYYLPGRPKECIEKWFDTESEKQGICLEYDVENLLKELLCCLNLNEPKLMLVFEGRTKISKVNVDVVKNQVISIEEFKQYILTKNNPISIDKKGIMANIARLNKQPNGRWKSLKPTDFECFDTERLKCDTSTDYHKLCNAIKDESFLKTMLDNRIEYMPIKIYLNDIDAEFPRTLTLCIFGKNKITPYTKIIEYDVEKYSYYLDYKIRKRIEKWFDTESDILGNYIEYIQHNLLMIILSCLNLNESKLMLVFEGKTKVTKIFVDVEKNQVISMEEFKQYILMENDPISIDKEAVICEIARKKKEASDEKRSKNRVRVYKDIRKNSKSKSENESKTRGGR